MKAITIQSPYALAFGDWKQYETRRTRVLHSVVGQRIAIHCGQRTTMLDELRHGLNATPKSQASLTIERALRARNLSLLDTYWETCLGCIVATALVHREVLIQDWNIKQQSPLERALGWWYSGYYAYQLTDITYYRDPIPARGNVGLWTWNVEAQS